MSCNMLIYVWQRLFVNYFGGLFFFFLLELVFLKFVYFNCIGLGLSVLEMLGMMIFL